MFKKKANNNSPRIINKTAKISDTVIFDYGKDYNFKLGKNSQIRDYSVIEMHGKLDIGDNCVIGTHSWLQASGRITLEEDVIIGSKCNIVSSEHDKYKRPFFSTPLILGEIYIKKHVWIGANVTILNNVTIGSNVIIGANSVAVSYTHLTLPTKRIV